MAAGCTGPGEGRSKCGRPVVAGELCSGHYMWQRRHPGEPLRPLREKHGALPVDLVPVRFLAVKADAETVTEVAGAKGVPESDIYRDAVAEWAARTRKAKR